MSNDDEPFNPSLAAALMKLDPEDGEKILEYFKTQALLTREKALLQASVREQKKLLVENAKLKKDIEQLRGQLQDKQRRRAAKLLLAPPPLPANHLSSLAPPAGEASAASPTSCSSSFDQTDGKRRKGERKARSGSGSLSLGTETRVDVSRLDLKVGQILSAHRHPLVEMLLVQEVNVGEPAPRTVVSKLGGKTNVDELQGALAVLLCNVKACKVKGVVSQARFLCCSASDRVELLVPPTTAIPGDRVTFLNYPGEPDKELVSKQRVWDLLQPDLRVDCRGVANYKGCSFEVKGKGLCRAPSLTDCAIG
ncbi:aminoacyl tRNA synthase complex-interacting multifunctional protein 1 [Thalassophryne amazonica]|uniref:aminoacyl tRNA synthase complex-interacting multifunctional protein 1 n=1 Tax=Thalassophryne amazonica TaxID=390379 RepID=UPI0014717888|nr:aminoacyl tRNA synthase complex-interacting multifunctional protein 1 [Thalassophryne amazonica]